MYSAEDNAAINVSFQKLKDVRGRHAANHTTKVANDSLIYRIIYHFALFCSKFDPKYWAVLMQVIWGAVVFFILFSGWLYYGDYRCFVSLPLIGVDSFSAVYCSTINFPLLLGSNCSSTNCSLVAELVESCQPSSFTRELLLLQSLSIPRIWKLIITTIIALLILTLDNAFSQYVHHADFDSSKAYSFHGAWAFVLILHLVRTFFFLWVASWVAAAGAPLCSIPDHFSVLITVFFFMFAILFIIALVNYLMAVLYQRMESKVTDSNSEPVNVVPMSCFPE